MGNYLESIQSSYHITITEDIDFYCRATDFKKKIAICNERRIGQLTKNIDIANKLKPVSDLVVFELGEMMYTEVIDTTINDNMHYLIPGFLNKYNPKKFIFLPNFFIEMNNFYRELPQVLELLEPYSTKPYYFDALLGTKKTHRDFIYQCYLASEHQNKILINYRETDIVEDRSMPLSSSSNYFWEPGTTNNTDITYSGHIVKFHNVSMPASSVLPVLSVYNKSAYSIVAETAYHPESPVFYTEKTVKPILARRLFIMFTAKNFLAGLKKVGFKTFDNVIDESYDAVDDDQERWAQAFKQIEYLCTQEQSVVLEKIKPIVEHNYQLLTNTDWRRNALMHLSALVEDVIKTKA